MIKSSQKIRIVFRVSLLLMCAMIVVATVLSPVTAYLRGHEKIIIDTKISFWHVNTKIFAKILANNILLSMLLFCFGLFRIKSNYVKIIIFINMFVWAWNYSVLFCVQKLSIFDFFLILSYLYFETISYVIAYFYGRWKIRGAFVVPIVALLALAAHIETVIMR